MALIRCIARSGEILRSFAALRMKEFNGTAQDEGEKQATATADSCGMTNKNGLLFCGSGEDLVLLEEF